MTMKDRITKLMKRENLNATQLLMKIHDILYPELHEERYDFCEKNKGNFSKMINGIRSFPFEYVAPMERILNTTMDYIVNGGEQCPQLRNKGIEYTAYLNDYEQYVRLGAETVNDDDLVIEFYDEYGKGIIDYIIEYQSEQGIKYLYDNCNLRYERLYDWLACLRRIRINNREQMLMIAELLVLKREYNLLYRIFDPFQNITYQHGNKDRFLNSRELMDLILNDCKLLKEYLKSETLDLSSDSTRNLGYSDSSFKECVFINPMLGDMLTCALGDIQKHEKAVNEILDFGIEHGKSMIRFAEKNYSSFIEEIKINENGYITKGWIRIGSVLCYNKLVDPDLPDGIKEKINTLAAQKNAILNLKVPNVPTENTITQDGKYIWKKSSGNETEYEMYRLCEKLGIDTVPKYYESKEGLDRIDYMPGDVKNSYGDIEIGKIVGVVRWLKEFQEKIGDSLGEKTYVHGALNVRAIKYKDNEISGVINWQNCRVGEKYRDFIYIIINWLHPGLSERRGKEVCKDILTLLKEYGASEELRINLPSLINNEVEKRLATLDKEGFNYEGQYRYLRNIQIFLELHGDKISGENKA